MQRSGDQCKPSSHKFKNSRAGRKAAETQRLSRWTHVDYRAVIRILNFKVVGQAAMQNFI
ncbi:hypothetical protein KGM_210808A, partial [Danaus plexippus plexippus]